MSDLTADITIDASADNVWRILTDFAAYAQWNPFIPSASGEARQGARLTTHMKPPGTSGMTYHPTVLVAEPGRELRWLGHTYIAGLFDGEHHFTIEPIGDNQTRFCQSESFRGVLAPLFMRSLEEPTRRGFAAMNEAMKARAEALQLSEG